VERLVSQFVFELASVRDVAGVDDDAADGGIGDGDCCTAG
jgi:hypothetical protein